MKPRHVLVTCGTSIRRSLCWSGLADRVELALSENLHDLDGERSATARAFLAALLPRPLLDRDLERAIAAYDVGLYDGEHLKWMSAELATLYLVDKQHSLGPEDEIELLHSAETPGCGRLLKRLLGERIPFARGTPRVRLTEVPGLDATDANRYVDALNELVDQVSRRADPERQRVYCITGGYKGTVATLLAFACWERTSRVGDSLAYYLYQDSQALISLPLTFGPEGLEEARAIFRRA